MEQALKVAVIGGGAAGMMAAGQAASMGADVTLFEKNKRLGKKLAITGKGRCNLTNHCSVNEFLASVLSNPRFLYASANRFSTEDTEAFFEGLGVPLKVERGNRVFPLSDKSADIVNALVDYMRDCGVKVVHEKVTRIAVENGAVKGLYADRFYPFDRIIVATGGLSYPSTGSDGDGYRFARALGIEVIDTYPSLVPLEVTEDWCSRLMGLTLKNIALRAYDTVSGKCIYNDFGELLFTHFGISGPTVLSLSAHLRDITPGRYKVEIDLKPALDEAPLDKRLLSDFDKYKNKNYANALSDLLPSKLIEPFVALSSVSGERKVNTITKAERASIVHLLKHLTLTVKKTRSYSEAIVTAGGVCVKELSPKTMEAKKVRGLFFAGEVIDLDAYTGGFNLQIAFSTAYAAAMGATEC